MRAAPVSQSLTRSAEIGRALTLFPGIPEIFRDLKQNIAAQFPADGIQLKTFLITGGLADLIAASPIGSVMDQIWGSNFAYDDNNHPIAIKNVVSFTEKTRFLFNIQKGFAATKHKSTPYIVNAPIGEDERPVPFRNMIYLGDGPSDVPCMSLIVKNKGQAIGVRCDRNPYLLWALGYGRRVTGKVPANFTDSFCKAEITDAVMTIANRMTEEVRNSVGPYPTY
jgi:hypothetical protein